MTVLHTLSKAGFIGTCSDLVEWLDYQPKELYDSVSDLITSSVFRQYVDIITSANEELRKPLSLSDFVRPDEPKKSDFTIENNTTTGAANWAYIDSKKSAALYNSSKYMMALESWENWQPLFPGWSKYMHPSQLYHTERGVEPRDSSHLGYWLLNGSPPYYLRMKSPTREDFIRECKRHSIPLLGADKDKKIKA